MTVIFALNQINRIFFNKMKYVTIHNIMSINIGCLDCVCDISIIYKHTYDHKRLGHED